MARVLVGSAILSVLVTMAISAIAQTDTPATAAYPEAAPAAPAPPAPATAPAAAAPVAPAPAAAPPPAEAPPPSNTGSGYPASPPPQQDGYAVGRSGIVEPPAPPPKEDRGFELPDMSVRVDPLNWIINGRLGLELEVAVWKIISLEMVPVFVTNDQPPLMNLGSLPATLYQKSNGIGAMSGTSIGAGFWLNGKPFKGTVLRLLFTNYGYRYITKADSNGAEIDNVAHTERRFVFMFGDHMKWGPFTIATGLGLGVELNRERRCVAATSTATNLQFTSTCPKDVREMQLTNTDPLQVDDLNGFLHPIYFDFRLSLGFVF